MVAGSASQTISVLAAVMELSMLLLVMVTPLPLLVEATSIKMDFLSSGVVRTDPLMF